MSMRNTPHFLVAIIFLIIVSESFAQPFVTFESDQFRPLAMSPDGTLLFATNTPDNRLEIFDVSSGDLVHLNSVAVGMEPVAVAARNNNEVWVVNRLSDSVSIVDLSGVTPRVVRTLLVGDEPADIVFAGPNGDRAFISAAHRGQNTPYSGDAMPANPGELTTPGIGRADLWVFDAANLGTSLGGDEIEIVTLFGDTPGPLARNADGSIVYVSVFKSGNQTTTLISGLICDWDLNQPSPLAPPPCNPEPEIPPEFNGVPSVAPGGLPFPFENFFGDDRPEVGLIVKYDGTKWTDEEGRNWNDLVRFNLPDKDVFAIDAIAATPVELEFFPGVGTVQYGMAVNPVTGKIYVANTDANNDVRFEGSRVNTTHSTVQGNLHKARITIIDAVANTVTPRHLNKHIDYSLTPVPPGSGPGEEDDVKGDSLAIPNNIVITADGTTLYVAAKGSNKVGIFDVTELENDTFVPDEMNHVTLSGGGPTGLALDESRYRLYVLTRFNNSISVVNTFNGTEISRYSLFNPEPASVVAGRPFLYDANLSSSNGEASCGVCHIGADKDELAWDLGDPEGMAMDNPNDFVFPFPVPPQQFDSMKGPMTTQTLRGMANHGPMHWRGDRTGGGGNGIDGTDPTNGYLDTEAAFMAFNPAFEGLLGSNSQLSVADMQAFTDFILQVTPPPNPIRKLDDSLTASQQSGLNNIKDLFDASSPCFFACHMFDRDKGFFGTSGRSSIGADGDQQFKVPQLRNLYEKVGMFGMANSIAVKPGDNGPKGDQIRGFGFGNDGAVDTLFRFHRKGRCTNTECTNGGFNFDANGDGDPDRRLVEQFLFATDSNMKPVVGQQITLNATNAATVSDRIDLFINSANLTPAVSDLVVKGVVNGEPRGWHMVANDSFKNDKSSELTNRSKSYFVAQAQQAGQEFTFTAIPPGSGNRIGIDQDEDAVLDGDDNCPNADNPGQEDADQNGVGDACEPLTLTVGWNPQVQPKGQFYWWEGLSATGGKPPYTFKIVSGWIPSPLTMDLNTGVISGIPSEVTTAYFTAQVEDANANSTTIQLTLTITEPGYNCGNACHSN